jgi:superfamily I DNA/RNA helicase
VDETQDLNRCQIELILRSITPRGRIVCVGDPKQAIYRFRGADERAIDVLVDRLHAKRLYLSVTYRCARSIVDFVKATTPGLADPQIPASGFEPRPGAPLGMVETHQTMERLEREAKPGDFILSRTNAPLVRLTLMFLRRGVRATMLGRDIGDALVRVVEQAIEKGVGDIPALIKWIDERAQKRIDAAMASEPPRIDAADAAADERAAILAFCEDASSPREVLSKMQAVFEDPVADTMEEKAREAAKWDSRITLSSTHKAKGLERDRVWMLAYTYRKRPSVEEDNLWYVACTRAVNHLIQINTDPNSE